MRGGPLVVKQKLRRNSGELDDAPRPPITFAYHDRATVGPGAVRKILCRDVGLGDDEALNLL